VQGIRIIGVLLAATILIWVGMGIVDALANSQLITSIAVLAAFGSTLSLWLVWGLNTIEQQKLTAQEQHKTKRAGDDEARLALLLALLTDDERRALKQRLLDDLAADGEALPLAALLDESQRARSGRS
jgi:hypothetical protein